MPSPTPPVDPRDAEIAELKNAWADTRLELANLRVYYEAACEDNERLRRMVAARSCIHSPAAASNQQRHRREGVRER